MCLGNKLQSESIDKLACDAREESFIHTTCELLDQDDPLEYVNFTQNSNLNIMHLNIHSLAAKKPLLTDLLHWLDNADVTIHVIMLCETYISELNKDFCNLDGYKTHAVNRTTTCGRGVAILTHECITFNQIATDSTDKICENHCQ